MKALTQLLFLLLSGIFLSACTQTVPEYNQIIHLNPQQQQQLSQIPPQWELNGRISIIYNDENWHARFHWLKQHNQMQMRFTGPMGQTHLLLEQVIVNHIAENTLTIGTDIYKSFGSMQELLTLHSGIVIPVESLQYWIFGHYNPNNPAKIKALITQANQTSNIKELLQDNWKVEFSRYEKFNQDFYPLKIFATDDSYKIKIFLRSRGQ